MDDPTRRSLPRIVIETSVVLTVLGGVAVLLRLAAVARGNVNLAFEIAHVSNFGEILLSTLLLVAPVLSIVALALVATWAAPILADWMRAPSLERFRASFLAIALVVGVLVVTMIFQTSVVNSFVLPGVWIYIGLVALAQEALEGIERRLLRRRTAEQTRHRGPGAIRSIGAYFFIAVTAVASFVGFFGLAALLMPNDAAWSATEVLVFDDREPFIGRVISTEGDWAYVIIDDPRELLIYPADELDERTLCDYGTVDEVEERLWQANFFGSVALDPTNCDEALDAADEIYQAALG